MSQEPAHPAALVPSPPATGQPLEYARPVFVENQRFTQAWFWVLLLIPTAVALVFTFYFLSHLSLSSRRLHVLLMAMAFPLAVPVLLAALRMNVVLTGQHLTARFFPLRRRIAIGDIASFRVITYTLADFGGWGVKWAGDGSLVLNISGNRAVRINRRAGKALILGTQRPDDFAAALAELGVTREPD